MKRKTGVIEVLVIAAIGIVFLFTRLYLLTEIPRGLHVDEVGMAYDAFSLANYGTDRYLNHFPVYLINYGGGQSALYAYLSAFLMKLLGAGVWAIRIPAVLSGGLVLGFGSALVYRIYGAKSALTAAGLITICPYFLMASRWGLDCNLFLGFFTASVFLLLIASQKEKNKWFFLAGLAFGITLYTYSLSWVTLPIFLGLSALYLYRCRKLTWTRFILFCLPLGVLAAPLILFLMVNYGIIGEIKTDFFTVPKLFFGRTAEFSFHNIKNIGKMLKSLMCYGPLEYNAFPEFGTMYYISIPFILMGFVICLKKAVTDIKMKRNSGNTLILIMCLSVLFCGLIIDDSRVINKSNAIFFSFVAFIVIAARWIYHKKKLLSLILAGIYGICFLIFSVYYFRYYPTDKYPQSYFDDTLMNVVSHVSETDSDSNIYVDTSGVEQADFYILWEKKIPPQVLMREAGSGEPRNYDGYCMFLPDEIDEEGIYIIKSNEDVAARLVEKGFKVEEYCGYRVYSN